MEINETRLQERLQVLRQHRDQLTAELGMTAGAIRDIEYWLEVLASDGEESDGPEGS